MELPAPLFRLHEIQHVTATVETESGSQYVVIARHWGVVVTCTRGKYAGSVLHGDSIVAGSLVGAPLMVVRDDRVVLQTTGMQSVTVHEN